MGGGAHVLQLLSIEYINGSEVTLGVSVLARLRCGNIHHLHPPSHISLSGRRLNREPERLEDVEALRAFPQKAMVVLTSFTAQPEDVQAIRNTGRRLYQYIVTFVAMHYTSVAQGGDPPGGSPTFGDRALKDPVSPRSRGRDKHASTTCDR